MGPARKKVRQLVSAEAIDLELELRGGKSKIEKTKLQYKTYFNHHQTFFKYTADDFDIPDNFLSDENIAKFFVAMKKNYSTNDSTKKSTAAMISLVLKEKILPDIHGHKDLYPLSLQALSLGIRNQDESYQGKLCC
jgi:hypothetical protein